MLVPFFGIIGPLSFVAIAGIWNLEFGSGWTDGWIVNILLGKEYVYPTIFTQFAIGSTGKKTLLIKMFFI